MQRQYAILDVFTDRPLAGNPLAVVLNADGLDDGQMQVIAREFNLSETVFVLPAEKAHHSAQIRIFTPGRELPFAGHPTVGTAVLLALRARAENNGLDETVLMLEEKVGPVRCGAFAKGERLGRAIFDLPREAADLGPPGEWDAIADALGLLPAEIGFENHEPAVFSAGVPYAFVPVRDLSAIGRVRPNPAAWREAFRLEGGAAFIYCRETVSTGHHFHGRMFSPDPVIREDPATGSAVAALTGAIARFDGLPSGEHRYVIEQGFEMARPSLIGLEMDVEGGRIVAARISGDAVIVAEGSLSVD
jgi:trans-2,3-dihydro-3-hydroxyanthranilate isomerase